MANVCWVNQKLYFCFNMKNILIVLIITRVFAYFFFQEFRGNFFCKILLSISEYVKQLINYSIIKFRCIIYANSRVVIVTYWLNRLLIKSYCKFYKGNIKLIRGKFHYINKYRQTVHINININIVIMELLILIYTL